MKILYPVMWITMILVICSCGNKDTVVTPAVYDFQAVSLGVGGDCHICLIKFLNNINKVDSIAGRKTPVDSVYYALNMPTELRAAGTIIRLIIREPMYIELPVCTALGPSYSSVYVLDAAVK